MAETLFYLTALLTLGCGLGVVTAKSPMSSVLALLGSFFGLAVVYLLSGFQFLAAVQLVVYAGAILVLFLFVIMLLDLRSADAESLPRGRVAALSGLLASAAGVLGLAAAARSTPTLASIPAEHAGGIDTLQRMALALFGPYALAFEATGMLLLIAMVAVIALAKRQRPAGAVGGPRRGAGGGA